MYGGGKKVVGGQSLAETGIPGRAPREQKANGNRGRPYSKKKKGRSKYLPLGGRGVGRAQTEGDKGPISHEGGYHGGHIQLGEYEGGEGDGRRRGKPGFIHKKPQLAEVE